MRCNLPAAVLALTAAALLLKAGDAQAAEVTVKATSGTVEITAQGHPVKATAAATLTLPVEIRTGADGTLDLLQRESTLHIGPNTTLALPEGAPRANTVDKITQSAGYVLYNIKARNGRLLSVETPYLVSVVKGTMFTIAVEDHASTVALMEGSLDISAPGVAEHVLLKPNESIRHASGEPSLHVSSSSARNFTPRGTPQVAESTALSDPTQAGQIAQLTRELAGTGAAVATGRQLTGARQGTGASAPPGNTGGNGSAGSGNSGKTGSGSSSTGTTGTGSGSTSSGGSGSSSDTGGTGTPSGSGSTPGDSGSSSPGDSGSSSGGSGSTPVTLPSEGDDHGHGHGKTGGSDCNGKNNGTGNGNCWGHGHGRN